MKRTITYVITAILSISFALMPFGREVEPNIHELSSFSLTKTTSVVAKQFLLDKEKEQKEKEEREKEIEEEKKKKDEKKLAEEKAKAEKEKEKETQEKEESSEAQKTITGSDANEVVTLPTQVEENTILDSVTTIAFKNSIYKNLATKSEINRSEQLENAIIYASNNNSDIGSLDETKGLNAEQTNLTFYAFNTSEESLNKIAHQVPFNISSANECGISVKVQQEGNLFLFSIMIATK